MKISKFSGIVGIALALSGCGTKEASDREIIEKAKNLYKAGQLKELSVSLGNTDMGYGPQRRFFDLDGDGKTVEQYVELYAGTSGISAPVGITTNLVRPGYKPLFDHDNNAKKQREMTSQEMKKLDVEYQRLLQSQTF